MSLITGIAESHLNTKQTPPLSVTCCFGGLVDRHTSDAVGLIRAHSVAVPHLLTWLQKQHAMRTNSKNRCCEASIDKREESEHNVEHTPSKISYLTSLWTAEHLHWNKLTTFKDSGLILKAGVFLNRPSFHFIIGNTATKCGNIKQKLCEKKDFQDNVEIRGQLLEAFLDSVKLVRVPRHTSNEGQRTVITVS